MAISFDASATKIGDSSSTTHSFAHTVGSGDNRLLLCVIKNSGGKQPISVTYAGVAMTLLRREYWDYGSNQKFEMYGLLNPSSGNNNITITYSESNYFGEAASASFAGVSQSGLPDAVGGGSKYLGDGPLTGSITTVANGCWAFSGISQDGIFFGGTTPNNIPINQYNVAGYRGPFGPSTAVGIYSNWTGTGSAVWITVSFAPVPPPQTAIARRRLLI